jgi:hypothetical protein
VQPGVSDCVLGAWVECDYLSLGDWERIEPFRSPLDFRARGKAPVPQTSNLSISIVRPKSMLSSGPPKFSYAYIDSSLPETSYEPDIEDTPGSLLRTLGTVQP